MQGRTVTEYGMLRTQFERFAIHECDASPLYRELALQIAQDDSLLEVASHGTAGPKPNLFLAAVHYLMLDGIEHPLSMYYPTLGGPADVGPDLPDIFRAFCLDHADEIRTIMGTRLVQTNEVRRSAILLPAMQLISRRENGASLALVEVGASAGLLLMLDRYGYDYDEHGHFGPRDSPVQVTCEIRGDGSPPLSPDPLHIIERTGIDLNPVDITNPDEALWLQALVWADQPERLDRLRKAIATVTNDPPTLIAGDALKALPRVLKNANPDGVICVFHCHTLNQFSPEGRERFARILAAQSSRRTVYEVALESYSGGRNAELTVTVFKDGARADANVVAYYDPHGEWIEWLQQS